MNSQLSSFIAAFTNNVENPQSSITVLETCQEKEYFLLRPFQRLGLVCFQARQGFFMSYTSHWMTKKFRNINVLLQIIKQKKEK